MSNAIHKFQEAKTDLGYLKAWSSLIGAPYHGGGGGIGEVIRAAVSLTVYHQASHGSTNYHDPRSCQEYLNEAAKLMGPAIIHKAIELAEANVRVLADAAKSEAEEVLSSVSP
jgi:hypothetical protein